MAVANVSSIMGIDLTGAGVIAALIGIIALFVRQRPQMKKLKQEGESALATRLEARIVKLEADLDRERTMRLEAQAGYDLRITFLSAEHNQVLSSQRHQINNLDQCLNALLLLLEQDPSKAGEAVAKIRDMRARQQANETVEKVALHRTRIDAAQEGAG